MNRQEVARRFDGKSVAIVGSGPGVVQNEPGFIDSHDVVLRVNNYKLSEPTGFRTDVYYSFFGRSIRKTVDELKHDGVTLCMCKLPNSQPIESEWHRRNGKMLGVDYRYVFKLRKDWWFCDTYIPTDEEFLVAFNVLDQHQPTSGFAAIFDVCSFNPRSIYLTGFDFFASGIHNVNEPWHDKNPDDPIRHDPERERAWLVAKMNQHPITVDTALARAMNERVLPRDFGR